MKVTKLIREYVEEKVGAAYAAKVNPYTEQANLDKEKLKAYQELICKQQREFLDAILKEVQLFNHWNKEPVTQISTSCPSLMSFKTRAMQQAADWDAENKRLKNAKIKEILLALELGANRRELEEMLSKMLVEE